MKISLSVLSSLSFIHLPGFIPAACTAFWGTYSLWMDTLLSLHIVMRALDLPQSNVAYPLRRVDGHGGICGGKWEEGRELEHGLICVMKKDCLFSLKKKRKEKRILHYSRAKEGPGPYNTLTYLLILQASIMSAWTCSL